MPDMVNSTGKSQLASRNAEASHLGGISSTDIGGVKTLDAQPNTVKVDGAGGINPDNSIPKSVGAEPTHLTTITNSSANKADDVDVSFGDDDTASDDLDEALDRFERLTAEDVEIDLDTDDDDDDKKKDKKSDDSDEDDDKDDDDGDKKDDKKPAFLQKEDAEAGDAAGAMAASANGPKAAMNSGPNKVKGDEMSGSDGGDGGSSDADKTKGNVSGPASDMNKGVSEGLRVRITLPNAKLFESAGVPKKHQQKVGLVFESVIKDVTKQITTQVSNHYKKLHEQKLAQRDAILGKQVDAYLNYVVEEWVTKNRVAIRSSLRTQLAEEFLTGLQRLFTEHYIDVPQSKVNVVDALTKQVASMKRKLSESVANTMKLRKIAESANKARITAQFVRHTNLSENQVTKFESLAASTPYTTAAEYRAKLTMLKESYFPGTTTEGKKPLQRLAEENIQDPKKPAKAPVVDPLVQAAMTAAGWLNDNDSW